ncbi:hypothetical protein EFP_204 [Enterococcus phage EF24C]|uniref:Uncharacterized protein n=1 Tax=Enterococcus phage phiEF24C TaxID=442493 RepID=A8E2Q6_BPPHE|nr:hypothetical protein EFP_gp204 [Enterococcus phage EF24C]BAF81472.1 hypothetical protein EFP_204 [Enterococcus phage EF24C]
MGIATQKKNKLNRKEIREDTTWILIKFIKI